jgi:hypothetical protein
MIPKKRKLRAHERRLYEAASGEFPEEMLWHVFLSPTFWREGLPPEGLFASRQEDDSCGTLELTLRESGGLLHVRCCHVFDWGDIVPLKPLRYRMPGGGGRSERTRKAAYALIAADAPPERLAAEIPDRLAEDIRRHAADAARAALDHGNYWPRGLETRKAVFVRLGEKCGLSIFPAGDGDAHVEMVNADPAALPPEGQLPADIALEAALGDERNALRNAFRLLALAIELDARERPERDQKPKPPRSHA